MAELLIEIFTEELPALALINNFEVFKENWRKILKSNFLESDFDFFYTPRRLVLLHKDFAHKQADTTQQIFGPPVQIAYNADKTPSKAMQSFLQKNNITQDEVEIATKDSKEVLFCQKHIKGLESKNILGQMVKEWLESLNFGKSMRWGNYTQEFIRPIRNICILLDETLIPCDIEGIPSSNTITPHRQAKVSHAESKVTNITSYLAFLEKNGVILNQEKRKQIILDSLAKLESEHQITIEIDEELLLEIVAITEYPTALLGSFDERFLKIPQEMIITSMKENQRYFAVYKNYNLYNHFVVVSNAFHGNFDLIKKGNEKVLKARLKDAEFFYENDLKANMDFGNLDTISFMQDAGSLANKVEREKQIACAIIELLNTTHYKTKKFSLCNQEKTFVLQALQYAKNDLLSQSVGEFPELQGIMGADFAKHINMSDEVCLAIREQYLPHGLDTTLPSHLISAIVNLAIKADSIFTLFSLNKIPTGSKDPFALRRQATGLLRICHQFDFNITIQDFCNLATSYQNIPIQKLYHFITERIYGIFPSVNPSIIRSVLVRGFGIKDSFDKILALSCYLENVDIKSVVSTFKRVANILESNHKNNTQDIDTALFEASEQELYNNLMAYKQKQKENLRDSTSLDSGEFLDSIQSLFALKENLDKVFDEVLILSDDVRLRTNRIALISLVFNEFLEFGDMREISIA